MLVPLILVTYPWPPHHPSCVSFWLVQIGMLPLKSINTWGCVWSITENKDFVNGLLLPSLLLVVESWYRSISFLFCIQSLHQLFLWILTVLGLVWFCFLSFFFFIVILYTLLKQTKTKTEYLDFSSILFARRDVVSFLMYTHFLNIVIFPHLQVSPKHCWIL